jgi:hypothetical protein
MKFTQIYFTTSSLEKNLAKFALLVIRFSLTGLLAKNKSTHAGAL